MPVVEFDQECSECNGAGLYVGMAEHDGAAVVCHRCRGTGCYHFRHNYTPFTSRLERTGVKRVFAHNPGVIVGVTDVLALADFGGVPYKDWLRSPVFPPRSEMRAFCCPTWWYQSVDYDKKPRWDSCSGSLGRSFSGCKHFATKDQCWARWDREFGQKESAP